MRSSFIYKSIIIIAINLFYIPTFANTKGIALDNKLASLAKMTKEQFKVNAFSLSVLTQNDRYPHAYFAGTSKINGDTAINANSLFKVGSIAKTYTSFIMLNMVATKKVKLDDHLVKYLPQYSNWKNITIAELLNQTSGIMDYDETPNWWPTLMSNPYKIWQPTDLVSRVYNIPLQSIPGISFGYSNTNYILLGLIIEKVSNQKIDFLMQGLIQTAKLKHTFYSPEHYDSNILKQLTHGYFRDKFDQTSMNDSWLRSAGSLLSTPNDMCLWMHYLIYSKVNPIDNINFVSSNGYYGGGSVHFYYGDGLYKRNSPIGNIYFVPGLSSGYVSMMGYVPNKHMYFSYSASNSPIPGLHKYLISNIIKIFGQYE